MPLSGAAQDITLSSQDGSISVSGDLLNYDGHFYRIDTEFGPLTVDGSQVTCDGPACPNIFEFTPDIKIATQDPKITDLIGTALVAFGASIGADVQIDRYETGAKSEFLFKNTAANRIEARFEVTQQKNAETIIDFVNYDVDLAYTFQPFGQQGIDTLKANDLGDFSQAPWRSVLAHDAWVAVGRDGSAHTALALNELTALVQGDRASLGSHAATAVVPSPTLPSAAGMITSLKLQKLAPNIERYQHVADLTQRLSSDPFALGITRLSDTVASDLTPLDIIGTCGRGFQVTRQAIKGGVYPYVTPLIAYRPARSLPTIATAFSDFLQSAQGHSIFRAHGLIDPSFETVALSDQGDRLLNTMNLVSPATADPIKDMISYLNDKRRLSSALRFRQGQTKLTAHSKDELLLIVRLIQSGSLDGQHIHFVGFSDGTGDYDTNVALSHKRAKAAMGSVLAELSPADIKKIKMSAKGFGPLMPILCDDTAQEQTVNRRVEIWLAPRTKDTPPSEN